MWRLIWAYTVYHSFSIILDTSTGCKMNFFSNFRTNTYDKYGTSHLKKGVYSSLKCKNFLLLGISSFRWEEHKFFPFRVDPLQKSKQNVTKGGSFVRMAENLPSTVNPHYTDTRYNSKIRYTDNLISMETLSQEVTVIIRNYAGALSFNTSSNI